MPAIPRCPEHQSPMREDSRRSSLGTWGGIKVTESETIHYVCKEPECGAWSDVESQIPINTL